MDAGVTYEDGVLSFRAALSGGALVIREELVEYRVHEASTSSSGYVKGVREFSYYLRQARRFEDSAKTFLASFETNRRDMIKALAGKRISERDADALSVFIESKNKILNIRKRWWSLSMPERMA